MISALETFGVRQLERLARMVGIAREVAGEHYRLGTSDLGSMPHEVRTLSELSESEIHQGDILADIARYEYRDPDFGRKKDLYRVNLQDHNILASLRRKDDPVKFSPLLLYVLTHEFIHVIRFVKFLTPFHLDVELREKEERRVHQATQRILSKVRVNGMDDVLRRYRHQAV